MKVWVGRNRIALAFVSGLMALFSGYGAWCLFTISYRTVVFGYLGLLGTLFTAVLYLITVILCGKTDQKLACQLKMLSIVGLILSFILLTATGRRLVQNNEFIYVLAEALWAILFAFCTFYLSKGRKWDIQHLLAQKVQRHKWFLLLILVTAFLLIEPDAVQFKWDGLLYYQACGDLNPASLSSLAIYGHIAQTYGFLVKLASLITGNTAWAMIGVNVSLMIVSICAFYGMLREALKGRAEWQCALATAIYAWSPYLLGMVYYHNLDFTCQCLFTPVLYFLFKKKWIFFSIASLMFCFTKEPAIIVYGAMCAGVVIGEFAEDKDCGITDRIRRTFARKQYYLMAVPGVLWLVTYKLLGPWSAGEGSFAIDFSYVVEKLKVLYLFNYNWIFLLGGIIGIGILLFRGEMGKISFLIPLLFSQVAFTLFSCLFKTVNHPRYNDTNQVTLYFIVIVISFYCCRERIGGVFHSLVAVLLAVSCFRTTDPVSRLCFRQFEIGEESMLTTAEIPLGDGMIYNRQMLGLERVMGEALADVLEESDIVLFPAVNNNAYYFDGMAHVGQIGEDFQVDLEYWDPVDRRRFPEGKEGVKEYRVYQLVEETHWDALEKEVKGKVNYFFLPGIGEELFREIKKKYDVEEVEEYNYRGWRLSRAVVMTD